VWSDDRCWLLWLRFCDSSDDRSSPAAGGVNINDYVNDKHHHIDKYDNNHNASSY
jgi:hypothetical protein